MAIRIPSARQPVTQQDSLTGTNAFTRTWFLFFQSVSDIVENIQSGSAAVQDESSTAAGIEEIKAEGAKELQSLSVSINDISELRAHILELQKSINSLQQGTIL